MTEPSYHLTLANGQHWSLQADSELADWLSSFAGIMQLPRENEPSTSPSWEFTIQREGKSDFHPDLWMTARSRLISVHTKRDGSDLITEMLPFTGEEENEGIVWMMVAIQSLYLATWSKGGIPVHAALIEKGGYGTLIAAAGGTGKSTCARRIPPPWHPLCDDAVLLVPKGDRYYAHPLPTWSDLLIRKLMDNRWDVGYSVPVSAIWFLERGEEDGSFLLGKGEGATRFYQSAVQISNPCMRREENDLMYKDWHGSLFNRCCDAVATFSCGILKATQTGRFWEYL